MSMNPESEFNPFAEPDQDTAPDIVKQTEQAMEAADTPKLKADVLGAVNELAAEAAEEKKWDALRVQLSDAYLGIVEDAMKKLGHAPDATGAFNNPIAEKIYDRYVTDKESFLNAAIADFKKANLSPEDALNEIYNRNKMAERLTA